MFEFLKKIMNNEESTLNDLNKVVHKKKLSPDDIIRYQTFNKEIDDLTKIISRITKDVKE